MSIIKIPVAQFKAAIFDMDGTMINNTYHHMIAWQKVLKRHGIHITDKKYLEKISGRKNDQIMEALFGATLDAQAKLDIIEEKEASYRELYAPDIQEVQGLRSLVDELRRHGFKTAVATNADINNRRFVLENLQLKNQFEAIVGGEDITHGKPDPEIFLTVAKKLSMDPQKCLVFEDTPSGIESAKRAGMTVVALLTSHSAPELSEADYLINDYHEIRFI